MLGSPVRDALAVSPSVLRTVRLLARLGDLGVPGVFSTSCRDGDCCETFRSRSHGAARAGHRGGRDPLAQRRDRRLARLRGSPRGVDRGRLEPLRHVRSPGRLPGARPGARQLRGGRMEWMSPIDSSFLHVENDTTPMHIGAVSIFEGPPPPFEELRANGRRQARSRPALPPEGPLGAARRRLAGVDRRPALQHRLPRAPHRDPGARERAAAAPDGRPRVLPAPRPQQAAVGDVGRRGTAGGLLGAAVEGPPLHGRRRRRDRPDVGDVLRHDRALGDRGVGGGARAVGPRDPGAHDRAASKPGRAAGGAAARAGARRGRSLRSFAEVARAAAAASRACARSRRPR